MILKIPATFARGVLLGILGGGVPLGFPNPGSISDEKCHFPHPFSDLVSKKIPSSLFTLERHRK